MDLELLSDNSTFFVERLEQVIITETYIIDNLAASSESILALHTYHPLYLLRTPLHG